MAMDPMAIANLMARAAHNKAQTAQAGKPDADETQPPNMAAGPAKKATPPKAKNPAPIQAQSKGPQKPFGKGFK